MFVLKGKIVYDLEKRGSMIKIFIASPGCDFRNPVNFEKTILLMYIVCLETSTRENWHIQEFGHAAVLRTFWNNTLQCDSFLRAFNLYIERMERPIRTKQKT